jgi:hypothetical protein
MPAEATREARNQLAVFLLRLCVISGSLALAATVAGQPTEPPAVAAAVPEWARIVWYVLLVAGGVIALAGIYWRRRTLADHVTALLCERHGEIGLSLGAALYGLALVTLDGWPGKAAGAITLLFAYDCARRVWDISRDLAGIRVLLRDAP